MDFSPKYLYVRVSHPDLAPVATDDLVGSDSVYVNLGREEEEGERLALDLKEL